MGVSGTATCILGVVCARVYVWCVCAYSRSAAVCCEPAGTFNSMPPAHGPAGTWSSMPPAHGPVSDQHPAHTCVYSRTHIKTRTTCARMQGLHPCLWMAQRCRACRGWRRPTLSATAQRCWHQASRKVRAHARRRKQTSMRSARARQLHSLRRALCGREGACAVCSHQRRDAAGSLCRREALGRAPLPRQSLPPHCFCGMWPGFWC